MATQNRERLLLITALAAVSILATDRLILVPLGNLWAERSARIATLQQSIERGKSLLDRETTITRRWEEMQRTALVADDSSAEDAVLKAANRWSNDSDVTFKSFKPQWVDDDDGYRTYDCRALAEGDLPSIARFVFHLETDPLAVRAEEIEVTSRDDSGNNLTLAIRFSGLQFQPSDE